LATPQRGDRGATVTRVSLRFISWAVACAFLLSAPLAATVILPATLDELASQADAVVYARVAHVSARQAAGSLRVERVVGLDVVRYLKGSGDATVQVRIPGGTLGRYRTVMPGAPELTNGDEAVFFLGGNGVSLPWLVGLGQGVQRIDVDQASGRRVLRSPSLAGAEGPIRRGDPARHPISLEEFEGRLAATLIAQRARRGAHR